MQLYCNRLLLAVFATWLISACSSLEQQTSVVLSHGLDESAGGLSSYIVTTGNAKYYLEKTGGGLSSMIDKDGIDWIGFNDQKGSGHKGEYRGFPNAIHKQDASYFHAMNSTTAPSKSEVTINTLQHVRIVFTSDNGKWQGQWDFYPDRLDFTMKEVSEGYKYWVQYEGVPGGEMDETDFWYASIDSQAHPINEPFLFDLPSPEWIAFGDIQFPRMLYLYHHQDDEYPDNYVSRPYMTVLGFGRSNKDKYLDTVQSFSLGFVETTDYSKIQKLINNIAP